MKIYTKTGDQGMTGLLGKGRVFKDDLRLEAYGTVDELNSVLGQVRAEGLDPATEALAARIQNELFVLGSAMADPDPAGKFYDAIGDEHVGELEKAIDAIDAELAPMRFFILPGGTKAAAGLHLARTVCRRAERSAVSLSRQPGGSVSASVLVYLNRLSDLLFVMARVVNHRAGVEDIPWKGI
ncbi:cob(I)yrinic acid a,c-diamide adenosyltransferase [Aquisphaera insulae]|uniref:cob(I)yrinic acid a,c-diamide adenosyltransferase n=1 Tax=Aquisphaera insulae TaxID=2712864 RepID=UPI0013EDF418|nr:cob(I)yrinic acid a,c-diamide adenosyltransferase [Aquisphaera insulae]